LTLLEEVFNSTLLADHFFLQNLVFGFKFDVFLSSPVGHLLHSYEFFIKLFLLSLVAGLVLFINVHLTSSARPSGDIRRVRLRLRVSTKNTCQTIWKLFWSDWSWLRCSRHTYVVILVLIAGRLRLRHKVSHERITWLAFWNGRASQVEGSHHLLLLLSFHILLSFTEHSRAARLTRHIACSLMRQPRAIHEIILILCGIGPLFSSLHRCLHVQLSSTSVKHKLLSSFRWNSIKLLLFSYEMNLRLLLETALVKVSSWWRRLRSSLSKLERRRKLVVLITTLYKSKALWLVVRCVNVWQRALACGRKTGSLWISRLTVNTSKLWRSVELTGFLRSLRIGGCVVVA
jgi:hypothetical protein